MDCIFRDCHACTLVLQCSAIMRTLHISHIRNPADQPRVKNLMKLRGTRLSHLFYYSLVHIESGKIEKKKITLVRHELLRH